MSCYGCNASWPLVRTPPDFSASSLFLNYVQHQLCERATVTVTEEGEMASTLTHVRDAGARRLLMDPRGLNAMPSQYVTLVARSLDLITEDVAEAYLTTVLLGGDVDSYVRACMIRPDLAPDELVIPSLV